MNWHYLYIFAQVNLLEAVFLWFWFRHDLPAGRRIAVVFLANAVTHPLVFFGFMHLPVAYLTGIAVSEVFALVVEGFIYQFVGVRPVLAWSGSVLANLISWQLGPILTALVFLRERL